MLAKRLVLPLAALSIVASLLGAPVHASSPRPAAYRWMINAGALSRLQAVADGALVRSAFDNPRTIVIVGPHPPAVLDSWRSAWALSFSSYAAMQTALAGPIDPRIRAVVYDDEAWPLTPAAEQHDPAHYAALAAAIAHQHHLLLIATPATDLVNVLQPGAASKYDAFLDLHIAQQVARYADIYEIQAQGSEANLALYRRFVARAAAQARAGNAGVDVLAGLSTNPTGHQVTARQLYRAVLATGHAVTGYWLNIPGQSAACPSCGTPQPQVAAGLLSLLAGR